MNHMFANFFIKISHQIEEVYYMLKTKYLLFFHGLVLYIIKTPPKILLYVYL